jgi:hypothetical protein
VRVGREPMDPDILRDIEREYPDIEFDWASMREHRQVIDTAPEPRRRRPKREDAAEAVPDTSADTDAEALALASEPAAAAGGGTIPDALEGETPAERIAFLRAWHPRIVDRIPRRTADPVRRDALFALAAHLNPDGWTDADQVSAGLVQAAESLERLSRLLMRRRRRSRRRSPAGEGDSGSESHAAAGEGAAGNATADAGADSDLET